MQPNEPAMGTGRLEAFSDGVIAVIITIMVLELRVPRGDDPWLLLQVWPIFVSYVLSFLTVAIYWVNHHRLLHHAKRATNPVLWTNMLWLFFLSLIPFVTAYTSQNRLNHFSVAIYAAVMLANALSFFALRVALARDFRGDEVFAVGHRVEVRKNYLAVGAYALAVVLAYVSPYLSLLLVFLVAAGYFIPDARFGRIVKL